MQLWRTGWCFLVLLIGLLPSGFSQPLGGINDEKKINGVVTNSYGKPVSASSVIVSDTLNGKILAYCITNERGIYNLQFTTSQKSLFIQVKAMGYAFEAKSIPNKSAEYNFILVPKPTELPNVVVRPEPITKKGDTLNYLVSAFADTKDRSIADVLAKMPGIEITGDGRVLYQGKAIQKYYIEGMDLLEGKYNLANQNLPHLSVSAVQILENHQPIRILDSLVPTDRASLNIKLKSNISTTGSGRAGVGATPFLWDAGITPMVFKKGSQFIGSYQANNTGNDVSRQLKTLTIENLMEQLENQTTSNQTLQLIEAATPPVNAKRYLDNNVHLLTGNLLTKLNKELELRINASYLNDAQNRIGEAKTIFYTPQGDVALLENISNRLFTNELNTQFTLQQNTPKGYLKNMLTIGLNENMSKGTVENNTDTIFQRLNSPVKQFSNQLRWITPIGKQLVTLFSNISYGLSPNELNVSPGPFIALLNGGLPFPVLSQDFTQKSLRTHHYAEMTKGWNRWTINPKIGILTSAQKTESIAETGKDNVPDLLRNNLASNYLKAYASTSFLYQYKGLELTLAAPISSHYFSLEDVIKDSNQESHFVTFDPMVNANFKVNGNWRVNSSVAYQNSFDNFNQIFTGLVVENYRSIRTNNLPIAQTKASLFSLGIFYRDPIKSIFTHLNYQYQHTANPFIIANRIEPDGSRGMIVIPNKNINQSHSIQAKASKYVSEIKTTFSVGVDLGLSKGNQILDGKTTQSINRYVSPNAKVNTRIGSWFALDYQVQINLARNELKGNPENSFSFFSQSANLHFYPATNHYLGFMAEHFYNRNKNEKTNIIYPDLIYRYTIAKKRIDLQLSVMNLLNEKYYVSNQFNDFYFYQSRFQIRPRQLIMSVKFQF